LSEVGAPAEQEWSSPLVAIEYALGLEKKVNQVANSFSTDDD
jgi:ferritin heavy chain